MYVVRVHLAERASKGVGDREEGKKGGGLALFYLPSPPPLAAPAMHTSVH